MGKPSTIEGVTHLRLISTALLDIPSMVLNLPLKSDPGGTQRDCGRYTGMIDIHNSVRHSHSRIASRQNREGRFMVIIDTHSLA